MWSRERPAFPARILALHHSKGNQLSSKRQEWHQGCQLQQRPRDGGRTLLSVRVTFDTMLYRPFSRAELGSHYPLLLPLLLGNAIVDMQRETRADLAKHLKRAMQRQQKTRWAQTTRTLAPSQRPPGPSAHLARQAGYPNLNKSREQE